MVPQGSFGIFLVPQNERWKLAFGRQFLSGFYHFKLQQWGKIMIAVSDWDTIMLVSSFWGQIHNMLASQLYQTKIRKKQQLWCKNLIWFLNSVKVVPQACLPCLRLFSCLTVRCPPIKKLQISTKSIKKEKGSQLKNVGTFFLDLYLLYQQFCWPFFPEPNFILDQIVFSTTTKNYFLSTKEFY